MKIYIDNKIIRINGNEEMKDETFFKILLDFLETHKNELITNDELKLKEMLV